MLSVSGTLFAVGSLGASCLDHIVGGYARNEFAPRAFEGPAAGQEDHADREQCFRASEHVVNIRNVEREDSQCESGDTEVDASAVRFIDTPGDQGHRADRAPDVKHGVFKLPPTELMKISQAN